MYSQCSATISTSFLARPSPHFKFNTNYLDLLCSTAIKYPSCIPQNNPIIKISNSAISEIFQSNDITQELEQIYQNNLLHQEIIFYTDGSVTAIGTEQCSMGIGWVQINSSNQILHQFAAKIHLWPSAYKAELFSILSAISTAPRNTTIKIFTDS